MPTITLIPVEQFKPTVSGIYLVKSWYMLFGTSGVPKYQSTFVKVHADGAYSIDIHNQRVELVSNRPVYVNPHGDVKY